MRPRVHTLSCRRVSLVVRYPGYCPCFMELADHFVANPNAPEVKVCGTGIKMTVYLLGRCGEGSLTAAKMAWKRLDGVC